MLKTHRKLKKNKREEILNLDLHFQKLTRSRILQPRDLKIIEAIYYRRVMTSRQIAREFFAKDESGNPNKISQILSRRRLRVYYDNYLIDRFFVDPGDLAGSSPQYVALDKLGAMLIGGILCLEPSQINWNPNFKAIGLPYIAHLEGISEFRTWLYEHADKNKHRAGHYQTEHFNYRKFDYKGDSYKLNPDAYGEYWFNNNDGMHFYYEFDRGTMSLSQFSEKVKRYQAWYESKLWESEFKEFPIILCTTESWDHAKKLLKLTGEDSLWCFSSHEEGFIDRWITHEGEVNVFKE